MRFFFFSSRRRHTRSYGDWSSDVCSSDLSVKAPPRKTQQPPESVPLSQNASAMPSPNRSEERRVGKSVDLGGRSDLKRQLDSLNKNMSQQILANLQF